MPRFRPLRVPVVRFAAGCAVPYVLTARLRLVTLEPVGRPCDERWARAVISVLAVATVGTFATPGSATTLEFAVRGGVAIPTEGHPYQPALAPSGGLSALVELDEHFAAGAVFDTLWLSWHSPPGGDGRFDGPLEFPEDGTRSSSFALAGRFYPLVDTAFLPFVEGSVGYASVSMPDNLHCDVGSGLSGGLAFGTDFTLSSQARFGFVAGARPLRSARACYPEGRADPPALALALTGQLAFTTLWTSP